jgi:SAM-dependent methyltransferase
MNKFIYFLLPTTVLALTAYTVIQMNTKGSSLTRSEKRELEQLEEDIIHHGMYTWDCENDRPHPAGSKRRPYQELPEVTVAKVERQLRRKMEHRYLVMNFPKSFEGKTVLDLGCNLGRICLDSAKRGATRVVGVDLSEGMIDVNQRYASWRHKHHGEPTDHIEYYTVDLNEGAAGLKKIIGDQKFDHIFCLAVWGVVDHDAIWDILNTYAKDTVWFEGHNIDGKYGDQSRSAIAEELMTQLNNEEAEFLGYTSDDKDRLRANFKVKYTSDTSLEKNRAARAS